MLELLGFKKTTHVGISLSANNFIELMYVDKITKNVVRYASGNVKYNNAIKEVIDYDELKGVIGDLFDEAGLDPSQCAVTVSLPNVHFAIIPHDEGADAEDNIQEEIEDLYIFKKNEPKISYVVLDGLLGKKNDVYSAIQEKVVVKLVEIFDELGATLERIESSYSALLKALQFHDNYKDLFLKEEQTTIFLISQTSCSSFYMNGDIVMDYSEEPLAVKSFSPEEIHTTIARNADAAVNKNTSKSLLIISETDDVNAEIVSQRITASVNVEYINKSVDVSDSFIDENAIDDEIDKGVLPYITIESFGAAVSNYDNYPLDINFMPAERINNNIVVVGPYEVDFIRFVIVCIGLAVLLALIIAGLVIAFLSFNLGKMNESNMDNQREIKVFKEKIAKSGNMNKKDMLPILTNILESNKNLIAVFTALSTEIPDNMYIKRFITDETGAIGILGEASNSAAVERFVTNLKDKNNALMLSRLSVNSKYDTIPAVIPDGFTFEIKTNDKDISLQDDVYFQPNGTVSSYNPVMHSIQNSPAPQVQTQTRGMIPPPSPII